MVALLSTGPSATPFASVPPVHTTEADPLHTPFWQVSIGVRASPSSHTVQFAAIGATHAPVAVLHVAMEPQAGRMLNPSTWTRVVEEWGKSFSKSEAPQAQSVPSDFSATVRHTLAATAMTLP